MKTKDIIQKEALAALLPLHRGGVGVTMGGGKTLIGLRHMDANYNEFAKFLVTAPKKSVFKEWLAQAVEHGLDYLIPHIEFSTYLSLPKQSLDYDVVYLDECHSLLPTHEAWLNSFKGKIVGLTGTPPRYKGSEKGKLVSQFCPIVYTYVTDDAIKDKILNNYKIIIHSIELDRAKTIKVENKGKVWYTSEQTSYDYWCNRLESSSTKKEEQIMRVMRMKALMGFPSKEILAQKLIKAITDKLIVFANTQDQADRLCPHSCHSNNPDSDENLEKFKKGSISLLSAVLQLNEGVNIPNLKQGIIMHAYGNERKASQRIGRLLRLNPKDTAIVHILCYENTVDATWINSALEGFDSSKISYQQH